jgi:hypothetical protein
VSTMTAEEYFAVSVVGDKTQLVALTDWLGG